MPKDRLLFVKEGRGTYISHLDLMRTFQRAFMRADLPIKHTEGFNPHPFISIALPLSLGFSSRCEFLEFELLPGILREEVPQRLNAALPEGIVVLSCYEAQRPIKDLLWLDYAIQVDFNGDSAPLRAAWGELLDRKSWVIEKKSKKAKSGVTTLDISPLVKEYSFTDIENTGFLLRVTLSAQNPGLNPSVMVNALTEAAPQFQPEFVRYCRREALDKEGKQFR